MYGDTLTLNIHDSINDERFQVTVSAQLTVGDLIEQLTNERGLPRYDFLGEPLGYELVRLQADEVLARRLTFAEINPRSGELFELRGKEASLVQDLIDELVDEIKENIAEELFDLAREKLQRIDRTHASNSEIEAAHRELQSVAARSSFSPDATAADRTMTHQPDSPDVTLQASDRQQRRVQEARRGGRRGRGCLTLGLVGVGLLIAAAGLLFVLVILPGLQAPPPAAPPPQITTEEPAEPQPTEPVVEGCEEVASPERVFIDPQQGIASVIMVNQGSCIWEPGFYTLEFVGGDPIEQALVLERQIQPGAVAEFVMRVPAAYFETSRRSEYEFISPFGPIASVVFEYVVEEVQCNDRTLVQAAFLDYKTDEAVFLLLNNGDCQWDQGVYKLVFVEGDIIQPEQDLPFTVVPGSEVEIRMPVPPGYYEVERVSIYSMARDGQPFDNQAVVSHNIID